jgi:serpin B
VILHVRRTLSILVVLAVLFAACGSEGRQEGVLVASDVERGSADAPAADIAALTAGGRAFAAEAYSRMATASDGNLVFSPSSIRLALAMAYAGAGGETAAQMKQVLRFDLDDARLHAAMNALDQALAARNRDKVVLSIANALWGQQGLGFSPGFLDVLARDYGAGMRVVDYRSAAAQARKQINDWVAEETGDRISDLIPEGALSEFTRLVLTNAVYLDATWSAPFDANSTGDGSFTLLDGSQVTARMMFQEAGLSYAAGNGWQAVELPYVGDELAMLFVVPDSGLFSKVEGLMSDGLIDQVLAGLAPTTVRLTLPKFEFRAKTGLSDLLENMGMIDAFDLDKADFSGMTTEEALFISDAIHEAFISVDEAGTEAAAATAVVIGGDTAIPPQGIELELDRPFLFTLYDRATGEILFLGRVLNPTG